LAKGPSLTAEAAPGAQGSKAPANSAAGETPALEKAERRQAPPPTTGRPAPAGAAVTEGSPLEQSGQRDGSADNGKEQDKSDPVTGKEAAVPLEPSGSGPITRLALFDAADVEQGLERLIGNVEDLSNALFSNQPLLLWLAGLTTAGLACELVRRQLLRPPQAAPAEDPSSWWFLAGGGQGAGDPT
jgi:hypothetical protein